MEIKILDFTGKWCSTCIVLDKIMEAEIIPKYKTKESAILDVLSFIQEKKGYISVYELK